MARRKSILILPVLRDRKGDLSKQWFVEFSVRNPKTDEMVRHRVMKGINDLNTEHERKKYGEKLVNEYTKKLLNGWVPGSEEIHIYEDQITYHQIAKNYGRRKKANRNIRFVASAFIDFKSNKLAAKSMSSYNSKLRLFVSWCENNGFEETDISAIKNADVKTFFEFTIRNRDLDKVTVKKYRQTLYAFFNWVETKYGIRNPVYDIELPVKKVDNAARPILRADFIKILDYTEYTDPQLHLALLIQYYSAIRPGNELLNLKIKDIDLYNNQAVITAITAKAERRIVTLPKALVKIMTERYLLQTFNPEFYVFGRTKTPGPQKMGQNTLRNRFNQVRDRLNLPTHYKFYSPKHTGAGKLLESGRTIVEVKDWCGHKHIEHTEHYIRRHFGIKNERVINDFPDPRS